MNFSYMLSSCNDELFIYRDNQCFKKKGGSKDKRK